MLVIIIYDLSLSLRFSVSLPLFLIFPPLLPSIVAEETSKEVSSFSFLIIPYCTEYSYFVVDLRGINDFWVRSRMSEMG